MPLTPEQAEKYERAAAALEMHERLGEPGSIAWKAWYLAQGQLQDIVYDEPIDNRAALLLRECVAKNEDLTR